VLRLFRRERLGLKPPGMMEEGEPNERAFEAWLRDAAIIKAPEPAPAAPPPKPSGPVSGVPAPHDLVWLCGARYHMHVWRNCSVFALPPCLPVRCDGLLFAFSPIPLSLTKLLHLHPHCHLYGHLAILRLRARRACSHIPAL